MNDAPDISDFEYDILRRRLVALESSFPELGRADSPTGEVGAPIAGGFAKIRHRNPMMSLDKIHDEKGLRDFFERVRERLRKAGVELAEGARIEMRAEGKIDGLALAVRYERGSWCRPPPARREHWRGCNKNARTIADLPHALDAGGPEILEVGAKCI